MQYIFIKDFPPTKWKKGDVYIKIEGSPDEDLQRNLERTAVLLSLGVIEEFKEEKRWKPLKGNHYITISTPIFGLNEEEWNDSDFDEIAYLNNNVFRLEEESEALEAAELIKKTLKQFKQQS